MAVQRMQGGGGVLPDVGSGGIAGIRPLPHAPKFVPAYLGHDSTFRGQVSEHSSHSKALALRVHVHWLRPCVEGHVRLLTGS